MITLSTALLAARLKAETADVKVLLEALGVPVADDGTVLAVDMRGRLSDLPESHRVAWEPLLDLPGNGQAKQKAEKEMGTGDRLKAQAQPQTKAAKIEAATCDLERKQKYVQKCLARYVQLIGPELPKHPQLNEAREAMRAAAKAWQKDRKNAELLAEFRAKDRVFIDMLFDTFGQEHPLAVAFKKFMTAKKQLRLAKQQLKHSKRGG